MSGDHLGYTRVSTQKESLEFQLDALRAAGCARVWSDVGTGQHARSSLTEVLDYLRPGDTLIVWRLDRIGRRTGELIQLVTDLAARDIGVRSLTEPIDTTTPAARTILDVLAAFAQTEANLVRESTHAGLAAARARGRRGGRPTVVTPDRLAEAHRLRESGSSFSVIAQALAISRATVSRSLSTTPVPDLDNEATDRH
jgi:DNA invertase Pin-like site-specific DNA recombinase